MLPVAACTLEIDAPLDHVWQAMIDLPRYREWNPFIVAVDTADAVIREGTAMTLHVRWARGGGTRSPEMVSRIEPPASAGAGRRARLDYTFTGWPSRLRLIQGVRVQTIAQAPGAATIYETREEFSGLLARAVPLGAVQDGFERHARALKARAEAAAAR